MNEAVKRMLDNYQLSSWQDEERAIREILQEIALVGLWRGKFFEKAAFYGGTALRILHGLDRFSEDLDFTLYCKDEQFNWAPYAQALTQEIGSYGFTTEFIEKKKTAKTAIRSAFLKANTVETLLSIGLGKETTRVIHPDTLLRIKVEIDTDPISSFETEEHYLKDPTSVPIKSVVKPDLFASKVHAALYRAWKNRVKGRDWYDLVWFIRRGVPLNLQHLAACLLHFGKIQSEKEVTLEYVQDLFQEKMKSLDFSKAKEDIIPFLRNPEVVDEWSAKYFTYWLEQMKVQT